MILEVTSTLHCTRPLYPIEKLRVHNYKGAMA